MDSVNFEGQSSRMKISGHSYFKTDIRENGSLATDFSMDPILGRHQESSQY